MVKLLPSAGAIGCHDGEVGIVIWVRRRNESTYRGRGDGVSAMLAQAMPFIYYVFCGTGIEGPLDRHHLSMVNPTCERQLVPT
jgi:hypothetical protein